MQKCFLTINKETMVANYLRHRSIIEVVEEHRSLTELNLEHLDIVDVDKFLYIYYQTDDGGLSFRSDMNAMRTLFASAFFHASEALFILVESKDPMLEDLIFSALRDAPLGKEKIEIINHSGPLMFNDIGAYLSGSASGQTTTSSYRDVFIQEADKEEKERYTNKSTGIDSVLPVLTDMAAIYKQRAAVEATSAGRIVSEKMERPSFVKDFSRVNLEKAHTKTAFVVSGERWTSSQNAVGYLTNYFHIIGERTLIINLDHNVKMPEIVGECSILDILDIKAPITTEYPVAVIPVRFNQLGYVVEYLSNIKGVDNYIFYCDDSEYKSLLSLIEQLCEVTNGVYIGHYNEETIKTFISKGFQATALFLYFSRLHEDFNLKAYKRDLSHIKIVAEYPTEDVDYPEFFRYCIGGELDD